MVESVPLVFPAVIVTGTVQQRDGLEEAPLILAVLEAFNRATSLDMVYDCLPFPRSFTTAAINLAMSKGLLRLENGEVRIPDVTRQALSDGSLAIRLMGRPMAVEREWCVDLVRGYRLPIDWAKKHERESPSEGDILLQPRIRAIEARDWISRIVKGSIFPDSLRVSRELQLVTRVTQFSSGSSTRLLFVDDVPRPVHKAITEARPDLFKRQFRPSAIRERWTESPQLSVFRELEEHSGLVRNAFLSREWRSPNRDLGSLSKEKIERWWRVLFTAPDRDSDVEFVEPVAGFPREQYQAFSDLCRRTRSRIALLTSFLNPDNATALAGALNELEDGASILLLYGHANDESQQDQLVRIAEYTKVLRTRLRDEIRVRIEPTKNRSHEKIVVTDNSEVMVGSWNPGSSNPAASYLETSVILRSFDIANRCSRLLAEQLNQEQAALLREMEGTFPPTAPSPSPEWSPRLLALKANSDQLCSERDPSPRMYQAWRRQFQGLLQTAWHDWASPRVTIVSGDTVRDTVVEQVTDAKRTVLIATDAVTPAGLDVSLAGNLLANGKVVRILWGRADPDDLPPGPERESMREDAERTGTLLSKFRDTDPAKVLLSTAPMRNHSKVLIIDEERILVASDNLLAYGKERSESSSREIGLLIESPLVARDVLCRFLTHAPALQARPVEGIADPPWDLFAMIAWEARKRWKDGGRDQALSIPDALVQLEPLPRFQELVGILRERHKLARMVALKEELVRRAAESMGVLVRWDIDRKVAILVPFDGEPPPPPLINF